MVLPIKFVREELGDEIIVVRLQILHTRLGCTFGIKVIRLKSLTRTASLDRVLRSNTDTPPADARSKRNDSGACIERVRQVVSDHMTDIGIVSPGHVHITEPAVRLVDSMFV